MSNRKITGVVENFHVEGTRIANQSGEIISWPSRTTITVVVSDVDLSKYLDLEKPITITQED